MVRKKCIFDISLRLHIIGIQVITSIKGPNVKEKKIQM